MRREIDGIKKTISLIFDRRKAALYALCLYYAGLAIQEFRRRQSGNEFWENRTRQALDRMFSDAFVEENAVGWFMSHGVDYGVSLELANNREHEAIRPIVEGMVKQFKKDAREIYAD